MVVVDTQAVAAAVPEAGEVLQRVHVGQRGRGIDVQLPVERPRVAAAALGVHLGHQRVEVALRVIAVDEDVARHDASAHGVQRAAVPPKPQRVARPAAVVARNRRNLVAM